MAAVPSLLLVRRLGRPTPSQTVYTATRSPAFSTASSTHFCFQIMSHVQRVFRYFADALYKSTFYLLTYLHVYQVQRETFDRFGSLLSISRGCVSKCPYGCYYHNYGATTIVCISCCRSRGCNVGNSATRCWMPSINIYMLLLLLLLFDTWGRGLHG